MARSAYSFALLLYREGGDRLGQVPIAVDWEPAEEWTRFRALRRGQLGPTDLIPAAITPLWSEDLGEPYLRGFRVELEAPGSVLSHDFATTYFKEPARHASTRLVEQGRLKEGEKFRYRPIAFLGREDSAPRRLSFTTEEVMPPLPIRTSSIGRLGAGAVAVGAPHADDLPVYVPQRLLDETLVLTRGAQDKETGGVLIGHLHRDPSNAELFAETTAQIPARHAAGELTKLTFTSETWSAVQAALDLRRGGEIMLGWWHSHPSRAWCQKCPPEKQRVCPLAAGFFSEHDCQLHRTVFPRAYSVAMVVNDAMNGLSYSMFGWHEGRVTLRGFHVTGVSDTSELEMARAATGPDPGERGGD